jgi:translation elongation factor P/translation initiation factor 5A
MDNEYEQNNSKSDTEYIKEYISAGDVKEKDVVLLKGKPCKINVIKKSKTGKHGSAKVVMEGYDILTDNKIKTFYTTAESIPVPKLSKESYCLTDINESENLVSTLDSSNRNVDFPFNCDDEMRTRIIESFNDNESNNEILIDVLCCMGQTRIVGIKKQQNR